jgi:type III pantothenate kinase
MTKNQTIVIDAGNTAVKMAVFQQDTLINTYRIDTEDLKSFLETKKQWSALPCALSTVAGQDITDIINTHFRRVIQIDQHSRLPFISDYKSPQTLGIDRICNVAGLSFLTNKANAVCIDIGTCIKFDLLLSNGHYAGGSISPGISLRYKSLNDYTAKLPLISETGPAKLSGLSTSESIHSGVINGMQLEISGRMEQYRELFPDLTFFVTGGDAVHFDFEGKNNIFADENLTLKGLYYLYTLNAQ